jgi:hypothetical protein
MTLHAYCARGYLKRLHRPAAPTTWRRSIMRTREVIRRAAVLTVTAWPVLAGVAAAQDVPAAEISGGYNLLRVSGEGVDQTYPGGWYVDVAASITPLVSLVGAITGNYTTEQFQGIGIDASALGILGGVRLNARTTPAAVPFAQALFGGIRFKASATGFFSESGTDPALLIGGGLNLVPPGLRFGMRVAADYLRIFADDELAGNGFRFSAGAMIPLGRR